jgi:chlorobactene glucosyltransferase
LMFEVSAFNFVVWVAWVGVLVWLVMAVLTLRGLSWQKPLLPAASPAGRLIPRETPLVSVLVPARNEEGRVLAACIRSILAQDYGRFEVVAVNDRSTDATASILNAIAKADERLRVINGEELPAGWLGKPYALQQALDRAHGEWILATDADMIFSEQAVRTAIELATFKNYDAVTLVPRIECLSFWERVFMPTFAWFIIMAIPIERINDPSRKEAVGVGGFFLIRRTLLQKVGEYAAVRAEVAEDLRMAELLKEKGARLRIEYAPDLTSTRMQTNLREIWEGFTKNLFAGVKFNLLQALGASALITVGAVAPLIVALFCVTALLTGAEGEWLRLLVPTFLVWLIQVFVATEANRHGGIPIRYAFTVPLGYALFVAILINSAIKIATGSGVTWKGRKLYERAGSVRPPRAHQPID